MTIGLVFVLLCSAGFVAFATMASYVTDGPGQPLRHQRMLPPVALVFVGVVVATAVAQWAEHHHDWAVALNRLAYAVLIGGLVGLWLAVWMAGRESWRARVVRYSAYVTANPERAWLGALVVMVAFVAGVMARS